MALAYCKELMVGSSVESEVIAGLGVSIAILSAARSTWSPCGLSMLSTITPLAERGRGHRYGTTAAWFIVGALGGGATLGLAMAAGAFGVARVGLAAPVIATLAAAAAVVSLASDGGVGGFRLPIHRRQVNEDWLDQFRSWVYGAGFGWQIGTGLATFIMTSGVYLTIVFGMLCRSPLAAFCIGTVFGLVRGLGVLLGTRITSPARLAVFHRRFDRLGPPAGRVVMFAEAASAVAALGLVSVLGAAVVGLVLVVSATALAQRRSRPRAAIRRWISSAAARGSGALRMGRPTTM